MSVRYYSGLVLLAYRLFFFFFFFFQAEDGIRDVAVTGVQTCALPILPFVGCWSAFNSEDPELIVNVREPDEINVLNVRIGWTEASSNVVLPVRTRTMSNSYIVLPTSASFWRTSWYVGTCPNARTGLISRSMNKSFVFMSSSPLQSQIQFDTCV